MTRWATAANSTEACKEQFSRLLFVDFQTSSSWLFMHTGVGTIAVGNSYYIGLGNLGQIEPIKEDADPFPRTVRMQLSAVNSITLNEALGEQLFNRHVVIKSGFMGAVSNTLVSSCETLWAGRINRVEMTVRNNVQTLDVWCESLLRKQPAGAYYTKETLWLTYSGDTFFSFLDQIPLFTGNWGNRAVGPPVQYTGGWGDPGVYIPGFGGG